MLRGMIAKHTRVGRMILSLTCIRARRGTEASGVPSRARTEHAGGVRTKQLDAEPAAE